MGRPFHQRALALGLATWFTIGLAGCKPDRAIRTGAVVDRGVNPPSPAPQPAPAAPQPAPPQDSAKEPVKEVAKGGTITGVVYLRGRVPQQTSFDMGRDPVCVVGGRSTHGEQYVADQGMLANVYIYIKDGPPEAMNAAPAKEPPVTLEQLHCRFQPHVLAIARGGTLELRNSDGTRHDLRIGSRFSPHADLRLAAKGAPQSRRFDHQETMISILCADHPWMSAYLNVAPTPFYAVTDSKGHFDLTGLPPGSYTLAAVHERLGEQTLRVQVASNSQSTAQFTYKTR